MKTLYNRFVRWAAKGIWVDLFEALAQAGRPPSQVLIDSTAMKAHRRADVRPPKDFRRIATRYDRSATDYPAAVCLAAPVSYWL